MRNGAISDLSKGHMPEAEDEIIMDTAALDALGVEPEIGARDQTHI